VRGGPGNGSDRCGSSFIKETNLLQKNIFKNFPPGPENGLSELLRKVEGDSSLLLMRRWPVWDRKKRPGYGNRQFFLKRP
jgi:hypothetical protein